MEFVVTVTYLLQQYNYNVTTEDGERFVCTRQAIAGEENDAAPERISVRLEEAPKPDVWGKSLAGLYQQLAEKIGEQLHNGATRL